MSLLALVLAFVMTSVVGVAAAVVVSLAVATGVSPVSAVEALTTYVELATGAADSLDAVVAAVDVASVVASVATNSVLGAVLQLHEFLPRQIGQH